MNDSEQFKKELKELLQKYNFSIQFNCSDSSDLHGVYDQRIEIVSSKNEKVIFSNSGYILDANDIKIN